MDTSVSISVNMDPAVSMEPVHSTYPTVKDFEINQI